MKNKILVMLSCVLLIACGKNNNSDLPAANQRKQTELEEILQYTNLKHALDRFHLPFGDSLKTSGNQFIFSSTNTWDTSFVLMLERRPESVSAVYYQTTPKFHLNTPYMDDEVKLTYFDGFSFITDTTKWDLIIKACNRLLEPKDSLKIVGQVDGSYYILAHNSRIKLCADPYNTNMRNQFREFDLYIRKTLMRDIYKRKLDIGQQADRDIKKEKEQYQKSNYP